MASGADLITFRAAARSRAGGGAVIDVLRDLPAHLEWSGTRSPQTTFRLLSLDGPSGPAEVGTRFSSTGANMNGTFHDSSVVTVSEADAFGFETVSRLDRRRGAELTMHFDHRYDVAQDGDGAHIDYSCRAHSASYVPYWLKPGMRTMTTLMVQRAIGKQLRLLAELAEERAVRRS